MKKLVIFALVCLLVMASFIGCSKKKAETVSDEYFTYTLLEDGTYSIKAIDVNHLPETVVIPRIYQGKLVTQIAEDAFRGADYIVQVEISDGIKRIGGGAFAQTGSLVKVSVPTSVTGIGKGAFYEMPFSFTTIEYAGTKGQWDRILKAGNWDTFTGVYTVVCSDGDINCVGKDFDQR